MHPPPFAPDHVIWRWNQSGTSIPREQLNVRSDQLGAASVWQLHDVGEALSFCPPIPVSAMLSLHVWSRDLGQWVQPSWLNPKLGQTWATLRPQ